jgi:hypothetical protein
MDAQERSLLGAAADKERMGSGGFFAALHFFQIPHTKTPRPKVEAFLFN